jgi:hypothetical protein
MFELLGVPPQTLLGQGAGAVQPYSTSEAAIEPRRVSRRLQTLRGWSHGNEEDLSEILT